jgi:hypothetical protein
LLILYHIVVSKNNIKLHFKINPAIFLQRSILLGKLLRRQKLSFEIHGHSNFFYLAAAK